MFDTTVKGMAGEALVVADLTLQGCNVFTPTNSHLPDYDLVVEIDGYLFKVQVRTGRSDGHKIKYDLRRSSNAKDRYEKTGNYDILACVDIDSRKIAYLNKIEELSVTLVLFQPVNMKGYHTDNPPKLFENYTDVRQAT